MFFPEQFEPELTPQERSLRDRFVDEYMKDFSPLQAALRTGFLLAFAEQFAREFMACGYVQRQIAARTRQASIDDPVEQERQDKAMTMNILRQVAQTGSATARVAALRTLSELYGWKIQDEDQAGEQEIIDALKDFAKVAPV